MSVPVVTPRRLAFPVRDMNIDSVHLPFSNRSAISSAFMPGNLELC